MTEPNRGLNRYYGSKAVSRSLRHFLVGKGFKVFSSLAVILLLARHLQQVEYAAYVSFQALVTLSGLIASFGVPAVLFRYLPELRAAGNNRVLYRMLSAGFLIRSLAVGFLFMLAWLLHQTIGDAFNLQDWLWLLPWYFGVGLLRLSALSLSQALESLLWQREAQYSLAFGSMLKLAALLVLISFDALSLPAVVLAEAVCEALTLGSLCFGGLRRWSQDPDRKAGDGGWWKANRRRVFRYGAWSFALTQTTALYGSSPNRLVAARFASTPEVALLGLADSLVGLARRFMPARLLIGFIRPVFMARFSSSGNFAELGDMVNLIYRVNLLIFALPIGLLLVAGPEIFVWLVGPQYAGAAPLLAGFLVVVLSESMRALLELLVQAVEKNHILVATNLMQSCSLFLAILLFPIFGLWTLVGVNLAGTMTANLVVALWLRRHGHRFRLDWPRLGLVLAFFAAATAAGYALRAYTLNLPLAAAAVVCIFLLLCVVKTPFKEDEIKLIRQVLRR